MFDFLSRGLTQASVWQMALVLVVAGQLTMASTTLYLHRGAAHRGVDYHPLLAHAFRFWSWLTTGMITKEWVAIHRKHHARCETADDPHSPRFAGIGEVLWRGTELYRKAALDREGIEKHGGGTPDDWVERNVYARHSDLGPTLALATYFVLFGIPGIAVWALHMMWIPFWAAGVINGLGHWWGYRNFDTADSATNLSPWGVWIGGEELHNNHHAFPSSARFSLRRHEFDIGWAAIRILRRLGLATVLREAPALDVRPNIDVPDADTLKAMMVHRWQVATEYFQLVLEPQLRSEGRALPGRLRRAFRNDGRWLGDAQRAAFVAWIGERPHIGRLMEFRARLLAIYGLRSAEAGARLEALRAWCADAEASGIRTLEAFSARLKGYSMAAAPA